MPSKNGRKVYIENGYYHIYNRGVEKRSIFLDEQDYGVFLSYLKEYLIPKGEKELSEILADPNATWVEKEKVLKLLRLNNFSGEISLLAYCLMPNHFHFLLKQNKASSIDQFMNSLGTRYTMYFNHKYKRVGGLYQGVYKAVLIQTNEQLIQLSRYIHKQSLVLQGLALQNLRNQPSSYLDYLGLKKTEWVQTCEILSFFQKVNSGKSYEDFVLEREDNTPIQNLVIEEAD